MGHPFRKEIDGTPIHRKEHGQPSGPVLKKLYERAYQRFGQVEYQRLAGISVSHLYKLRAAKTYRRQRCVLTRTRPNRDSHRG